MVPSYVKKKNRIAYRYYVSAPVIRGQQEKAGTVARINASWLEHKIEDAMKDDAGASSDPGLAEPIVDRIQRITLHKDEIIIDARDRAGDVSRIRIDAALQKPKHTRKIFANGGRNNQNEGLIKAVAQAQGWQKALETGAFASVKELAEKKKLSERYVWKILRLAYLSPQIVEAILDGCQRPGLSFRQINQTQLSPDWRLQSHALGFDFAR